MSNYEKHYVNAVYISEKVFDNGGSVLDVSIKIDDFIEILQQIKSSTGGQKAYMKISKLKTPKESSAGAAKTHYMYYSTKSKDEEPQTAVPDRPPIIPSAVLNEDDALPF